MLMLMLPDFRTGALRVLPDAVSYSKEMDGDEESAVMQEVVCASAGRWVAGSLGRGCDT